MVRFITIAASFLLAYLVGADVVAFGQDTFIITDALIARGQEIGITKNAGQYFVYGTFFSQENNVQYLKNILLTDDNAELKGNSVYDFAQLTEQGTTAAALGSRLLNVKVGGNGLRIQDNNQANPDAPVPFVLYIVPADVDVCPVFSNRNYHEQLFSSEKVREGCRDSVTILSAEQFMSFEAFNVSSHKDKQAQIEVYTAPIKYATEEYRVYRAETAEYAMKSFVHLASPVPTVKKLNGDAGSTFSFKVSSHPSYNRAIDDKGGFSVASLGYASRTTNYATSYAMDSVPFVQTYKRSGKDDVRFEFGTAGQNDASKPANLVFGVVGNEQTSDSGSGHFTTSGVEGDISIKVNNVDGNLPRYWIQVTVMNSAFGPLILPIILVLSCWRQLL